jgi:ribosomal protein S27E
MEEQIEDIQEVVESPEKVVFEVADAAVFCSVCGTVSKIDNENFLNVKGGIQLPFLATTNVDMLSLGCPNCGSVITLGFLEATPTEIKQETDVTIKNEEEPAV